MYLEVIFQHPRLNSPINLQVFSNRCAQKDGWGYRGSWAAPSWPPLLANQLISCCHVDTRECQLAGMTRSEPYSQFQNLPAGCRGWSIPGNGANDMMEFVWCTSKWSKLQPWAFCRIERTIWGSIPRNSINDRMDILTGWNTSRRVQSIRWIFCRMEHR